MRKWPGRCRVINRVDGMQKVIRSLAAAFAVLSFAVVAEAQADSLFREYRRQRTKEFLNWRAEANAEFSRYLAAAWEEFLIQKGREDIIGPVPEEPVFYDRSEAVPSGGLHGLPCSGFMSAPAVPVPVPAISASYSGGESVGVDFFGITAAVPFHQDMILPRLRATEQDVSDGWKKLSSSDYQPVIEALDSFRQEHSISDWALYTIIRKLTEAVYIDEYVNERILTQMFLLSQMDYRARVGMSGEELILLLPFDVPVYQVPYVTTEGVDFYIYGYSRVNGRNPLYTFTNDFPSAERNLSLVIDRQMTVDSSFYRMKTMPGWAEYLGEDLNVPQNIPCVKFTLDYPQSDLLTYHRSAVDTELTRAVFSAVRYRILRDGLDPVQSVSFILELIQRGFGYKTDYEMFGRAKPMFVEESFFYGSNNCKDRVLLFSWLVGDLLGMDVVIFCYKGHAACGVALPETVEGDSYMYEGRRYVMCDPTYIGAPVGATMTKYRGVQPQIIGLQTETAED